MSAVEHHASLEAISFHDEMSATADARTLEILERRRKAAVVRTRGWLVRRMLLLADLVGLSAAFLAAELAFTDAGRRADHIGGHWELLMFCLSLPVWVVGAKLSGLYDQDEERTDHSTFDDLVGVLHLVTIGAWLVFAGAVMSGLARPELPKLVVYWGTAVLFVTVARATARAVCRRRLTYLQNTVIVGGGEVGRLVARKVLQHREYGINLVGFVDTAPPGPEGVIEGVPLLGPHSRLPAIIRFFDVERVIVAFPQEPHGETLDLVRSLSDLDVQVDIVPRLFEIVSPGVGIHTVEGLPLIGLAPLRLSRSSRLLKRTLDLVVSSLALAALAPVFALVAWRIKAESPGPVFFRQVRMGADERTFQIFKFRTMSVDADDRKDEVVHLNMHARRGGDSRMFKVPDDPRVTSVGRFLRRYSLDELPQLINVLRGEMSLVGPRPLILDEDRFVAEWARRRLDLKPGMTGLWQVLGGSDIPFEEMTKLDYLYVTNWSLWGDVRLIFQTIPALLRTRSAY